MGPRLRGDDEKNPEFAASISNSTAFKQRHLPSDFFTYDFAISRRDPRPSFA